MDTARVESLGLAPLKDELARIDAIATPRDVARYIGYSQRIGVAQPFAWFSSPDNKNSTVYLGALYQNGLTMPDRDYYLSPDEKYAQFRAKFAEYVEQMLARAGERNAKSAAARIAALETRIANYQWTKVQNRDPVKTYNPMTLPEYQKLAPGFDWLAFFEGMGAPVQRLDVNQPTFIKGIGQLVKTVPVSDWRVYFKFQLLDDYAPALSAQFADLEFEFHQKHPERRAGTAAALAPRRGFHGQQHGRARRPHVRRVAFRRRGQGAHARAGRQPAQGVRHLDRRARVDEPGHARRGEEEAGEDHREDRLSRQVARLQRADACAATTSSATCCAPRSSSTSATSTRTGGPVDKGEWLMTPQTVNAYYNPTTNEITFPAAILRPPFFDMTADDAVNYGGIGSVIGHEISHGFDDSGPPVRRRRQPARLVDGRRRREVQAARRPSW